MTEFITQKSFLPSNEDCIAYGFFTRKGGFSAKPFSGLNCGIGSDDDLQAVLKNREQVAVSLNVLPENLLSAYQVHGADVIDVQLPWDSYQERPKGDAMVTTQAGIALGVLTADCAPVLFYGLDNQGSPVIGCAHAGWKGALYGVLDNSYKALIKSGAQAETIRACIGPCIGRAHYEVSLAFADPFLEEDSNSERFFFEGVDAKHLTFDLGGYCASRLARCGVRHVTLCDDDTYSDEERFYSYRRATHRGETSYGRQISVIAIKHDGYSAARD